MTPKSQVEPVLRSLIAVALNQPEDRICVEPALVPERYHRLQHAATVWCAKLQAGEGARTFLIIRSEAYAALVDLIQKDYQDLQVVLNTDQFVVLRRNEPIF